MTDIAKTIILIGVFIILTGIVLWVIGKIPGVGKLPGDVLIKKENFTFYFPITTSIVLSIVISVLMYFFGRK